MALVQKYDCSGAIELSELNTIIFEYNGACFYLTYGNPCKMGDMNNMVLDIDDGFLFKYSDESSPQVKNIASVLQTYFVTWKDSNYEGLLFPQSMGLNLEATEQTVTATSSQAGMFANTASEYMTIGIDAVDYVNFKAIDTRIEHKGGWMERYPMGTSIRLPTQYAEEIIIKLKQHQDGNIN